MDSRSKERNIGFALVFKGKTVRGTVPMVSSIYTAEKSAIETALKRINKKGEQNWRKCTHSES